MADKRVIKDAPSYKAPILTKDMKLKIDKGESPIISQEKMYETPAQLALKLEEEKTIYKPRPSK